MNAARTGRFFGPQDAHGRRLSWDVRRRAYGHGSWRASPGGHEIWAPNGSFVRSAGVLAGPALLSAPPHGGNQRTAREGYTHGANGVLQVPYGRRSWPPRSYLSPSWGLRDRLFQLLGLGGLRFPHTYPSRIHSISLAWLSSTCGVQGSCVHLQLYERQVDNCLRKGRFWLRLQLLQQELQ